MHRVNMTDADSLCDAPAMDEPKDRLRWARIAAGFKSAAAAAKHMGIGTSTYGAHENGQNNFDYSDARKYGEAFSINPAWLIGAIGPDINDKTTRDDEVLRYQASTDMAPLPTFVAAPMRSEMPLNLAVYGFAVGGGDDDDEFYMNGQIADYVRRPPGVVNMRGVFGVYVVGDSMYPRFQARELVFATNAQTPAIGDDVVIELRRLNPGSDDDEHLAARGLIKRLKKRGSSKVVVEQFNPPRDLEFDREEVKALHRVLTNNDLYGS